MEALTEELLKNSSAKTLYLITGAAGHLGSTILRCLKATGCEVRGLLLPNEQETVLDPRFQYFHGNVCNLNSMRPLFENAAGRELIVIHTAALISIAEKMPPNLYDVNVNGVKNILRLCREYHVRRLVHVSSVHAIPELPNGEQIHEVSTFSANLVTGSYAKTKAEAAQAVLDAAAAGLNAVIVLPSGILGPYDSGNNHLIQMAVEFMQGKLPACVAGGYDFVDVRDVAAGCLLAACRGRKGEGYILSGHYLSIRELLTITAACCGKKGVRMVPMWLAKAAVPFIECYANLCGQRPLYTQYSLHTLSCNSNFSNEKAKSELGYTVRDPQETVADMVAWLQKNAGN